MPAHHPVGRLAGWLAGRPLLLLLPHAAHVLCRHSAARLCCGWPRGTQVSPGRHGSVQARGARMAQPPHHGMAPQ